MSPRNFLAAAAAGADLERTFRESARRQRGLEAVEQRFGQIANAPVEYGQLAGIRRAEDTHDFAMRDQRQAALSTTARLFKSALERTKDPNAAFDRISGVLTNVFGVPEAEVAASREALTASPDMADALIGQIGSPKDRYLHAPGQGVFDLQTQQWLADGPLLDKPMNVGGAVYDRTTGEFIVSPGTASLIKSRQDAVDAALQQIVADAKAAGAKTGAERGDREVKAMPLTDEAVFNAREAFISAKEHHENITAALTRVREAEGALPGDIDLYGPLAGIAKVFSNTPAAERAADVLTLSADTALSAIEELRREAAALGGQGTSIGPITDKDMELLKATRIGLDQAVSREDFFKRLAVYQRLLDQTFAKSQRWYDRFERRVAREEMERAPTPEDWLMEVLPPQGDEAPQ